MFKLKYFLKEDKNLIELLKGSSTTFVVRILGLLVNFLFIFIVSRFYGAKVLGIYALSLTLLHIISIAGKIGMDVAIMKYISEFSLNRKWNSIDIISRKTIKLVLPISLVLTLLLIFFSDQIATSVFNKGYIGKYFRIVSIAIIPNIFLLINAEKLRGLKEIRSYSFLQFFSIPFLSFLIIGGSLILIHNEYIPVVVLTISVIITFVISMFLWRGSFEKRILNFPGKGPGHDSSSLRYRELISLAVPIMFTNSLVLLMGWTDTIMLGVFRTTFEIGIYRVPLKLSVITATTLIAINSILGPKISELWSKKDIDGIKRIVQQSTIIIFSISLPCIILFWVFPKPILGIFGNDFKAASTVLVILSIGQLFNAIVGPVGSMLIMTGKQVVLQNIVLIGSVINIILNFLLIPPFGINGASTASMVSLIFINLTSFFYIRKVYGFFTFPLKFSNK